MRCAGPTIVAVVLARHHSRRAPGKVLAGPASYSPIDVIVGRLRCVPVVENIVVATTDRPCDGPIADKSEQLGCPVVRGPCDDVAARFELAARAHGAEYAVRLNADSPFVDPTLLAAGVALARAGRWDLITNLSGRTFPYGMSLEVVRVEALTRSLPSMSAEEREHVTQHLYRNASRFQIVSLTQGHAGADAPASRLRGTIDTPDELAAYSALAAELGDDLFSRDALELTQELTAALARTAHRQGSS